MNPDQNDLNNLQPNPPQPTQPQQEVNPGFTGGNFNSTPPGTNKLKWIIPAVIAAVIVLGGGGWFLIGKSDKGSSSNTKTTQEVKTNKNNTGNDIGVAKRLGPWEITVTEAKVVTDSDVMHGEENEILFIAYKVTNVSSSPMKSNWEAEYESDQTFAFTPRSGMAAPTPAREIASGETWDTTVYYSTPIDDRERTLGVGAGEEVISFELLR